ncbi:hypothetical protein L484_006365 [Morus notabilis]|uniref:Uncharacterized protein n=1 Tax=Morus notabilis TaxID=981085 RepID=W9S333_9ROSA|nr:hypothetical protein L484_006365 [Morus notabilis]
MRTLLVISVVLFLAGACLQAEAKPKYTIPEDPKGQNGAASSVVRGGRRLLDLNRRGTEEVGDDKEPNTDRSKQKNGDTGVANRIYTSADQKPGRN